MARIEPVARQLQEALDQGILPPERRMAGQQLLAQLMKVPRIAVIGLPGAGKTALINMILGDALLPSHDGVTVAELCHGEQSGAVLERADGSAVSVEGIALADDVPAGTVRIVQELADPRLRDWSFIEVNLAGYPAEQQALLDWTARRADIALWCAQRFDPRERSLWARVPERLKDNSFLVLTKADQLYLKRELAERIADLGAIVAEEFLGLYPLATMQALTARRAGGPDSQTLWQSSGGMAFLDGLRRQIDQARTADLDHATVLLEHCSRAAPARRRAEAAPAVMPAPAEAPVPVQAPASPDVVAPAAGRNGAGPEGAFAAALDLLQDCATELSDLAELGGTAACDRILDRCGAVAGDLMAMMTQEDGGTAGFEAFRDDVAEGEQVLMLLRLERGETAAADALTVLLQLKKELSERAAG